MLLAQTLLKLIGVLVDRVRFQAARNVGQPWIHRVVGLLRAFQLLEQDVGEVNSQVVALEVRVLGLQRLDKRGDGTPFTLTLWPSL